MNKTKGQELGITEFPYREYSELKINDYGVL